MFRYVFEDSVEVTAPAKEVYRFFEDMDRNYLNWHPDHKLFEWRKGTGLKVGTQFYFEELINGKLLKKKVVFTQLIPNRYIEFTMTNRFYRIFVRRMTFNIDPTSAGSRFTARIYLHGVGPIGRFLNRKDMAAVRKHMYEEGINLKRILEQQQF